jgi:hypothetical protein
MARYIKITEGGKLTIPTSTGKIIFDHPNEHGYYDIPDKDEYAVEMTKKLVALGVIKPFSEDAPVTPTSKVAVPNTFVRRSWSTKSADKSVPKLKKSLSDKVKNVSDASQS